MSNRKAPKRRLGKGLSAILDTTTTATKPPAVEVVVNTQVPINKDSVIAKEVKGSGRVHVLSDDKTIDASSGDTQSPTERGVLDLSVEDIQPGQYQPRTQFDEAALESLASSIRAVGVIQPITVRPISGGSYELIAGERRWRAAKLAGLTEIPAIISTADDKIAAETALIENLQREDLNPIERADAIRGLMQTFAYTQSEIADRVGLDRSSVSNLLRLADLEPEIRDMLAAGLLGFGHGKALLSADPGPSRVSFAVKANREGWSVRRLEAEVRRARDSGTTKPTESGTPDDVSGTETRALEKRLGEHLGTRVSLRVDKSGKGSVNIRFFDLDHFDDLMTRIGFRNIDDL